MKQKFIILMICVLVGGGVAAGWYKGYLADFLANYPVRQPLQVSLPNYQMMGMAHRVDTLDAPENTIAAIHSALAKGADYLEIDIRLASDGVPVLFHDSTVDRTTKHSGPVKQFSSAELTAMDAGSWFGEQFSDQRVPLLADALREIQGKACVMADIKGNINRKTILLLKEFYDPAKPHCLLIVLVSNQPLGEWLADLPAEAQQIANSNKKGIVAVFDRQYAEFRRYWPGFPYVRQFSVGNTLEEVFEQYPSVVAIKTMPGSADDEMIDRMREEGLFVYTLLYGRSEESLPKIFSESAQKGLHGLLLADIKALDEFQAEAQR